MAQTRNQNKPHNFDQHSKDASNSIKHTTSTSSTEENSSDEDDEDSVAVPLIPTPKIGTKTISPARTNKQGVPMPIQQELAEDIKEFGGLLAFKEDPHSTSKICRVKPDLYGIGGSPLRQQIRDKLKQWKKLSLDEYKQVLTDLGVWTSSQAAVHRKLNSKHNKESVKAPFKTAHVTTKALVDCIIHPPSLVGSKLSQLSIPVQPTQTMSSNSFTINVNTATPEANREVSVYDIERIDGVGERENALFKGYWICMPIDVRFILDDLTTEHWKARVYSSDTVLLSIQAWDYSQLHDRDEFEKQVTSNVLEAIDAAHHDLAEEPADRSEARKWKHLFLKFKDGVELAAKCINEDAGEDEKMKLELIPATVKHPKKANLNYTAMYAAWKVARTDIKANKKGKLEKKDDKSEAARLFDLLIGGVDVMHVSEHKSTTPDTTVSEAGRGDAAATADDNTPVIPNEAVSSMDRVASSQPVPESNKSTTKNNPELSPSPTLPNAGPSAKIKKETVKLNSLVGASKLDDTVVAAATATGNLTNNKPRSPRSASFKPTADSDDLKMMRHTSHGIRRNQKREKLLLEKRLAAATPAANQDPESNCDAEHKVSLQTIEDAIDNLSNDIANEVSEGNSLFN